MLRSFIGFSVEEITEQPVLGFPTALGEKFKPLPVSLRCYVNLPFKLLLNRLCPGGLRVRLTDFPLVLKTASSVLPQEL